MEIFEVFCLFVCFGGRWSVPYTNKGMREKTRRIQGWLGVLGKEDEAWGCVGEGWFEVLWVYKVEVCGVTV